MNAGLGFHSNDARGATITVDPATGEPADRVTPLVRAKGAEVGVRTVAYSEAADDLLAVDAEPRFRAGLRRRRRHHRGRPAAPPLRGRVGQLLRAEAVADPRRRRVDLPRALHRRRSGRRLHSRRRRTRWSRPGRRSTACSNVFGSLRWRYFGPRAAGRGQLGALGVDQPVQSGGGLPAGRATSASPSTSSTCSMPRPATSTTTTRRACRASPPTASTTSTSTRPCRAPRD